MPFASIVFESQVESRAVAVCGTKSAFVHSIVSPGATTSDCGANRKLMSAAGTPFAAYVPIDISRDQLVRVAADLATEYPHVPVRPVCADFTAPLTIPDLPPGTRRVAFFPGSTIGDFHPSEAATLLRRVRRTRLHHLVGQGGFRIAWLWTDQDNQFWVALLSAI